jgi:ribonuclease Z
MSTTFCITFLGTSAAIPTPKRNVSSTLIAYQDLKWLIDCGEGTQRQLLYANVGFKNLTRIVLSHEHLDHMLGIGGLLATLNMLHPVDRVVVHGSPAVLERVKQLSGFIGRDLQYELRFEPIDEGEIFTHRQMTCHAFPTRHRLHASYGFTFQEKSRRRFLADVADRLGVPAGPERRRLLAGESIRSTQGALVHPDDVLGPEEAGKKLVYISDTMYFPELSRFAAGADCLIAEATFLDTEAELAAEAGHMTARQSATVARDAGVKYLYLNHLSQRYAHAEHLILEEARRVFPQTYLAYDLATIHV